MSDFQEERIMLCKLRRMRDVIRDVLRHPAALPVFYFCSIWYLEWVFRAFQVPDYSGPGLLYSFLFCISKAFVLWILSSSAGPRVNRVFSWVITAFVTLLFVSQLFYNRIFFSCYSISSVTNSVHIFVCCYTVLFTVS